METFASLRDYKGVRFNENKDRFIQKSTVLTDEQKKEVLEFFHSHANLEAKVNNGNWNYNIPYEEFKRVIDSVDTAEKRLKKQTKELRKQKGLEGLVEGEDYNLVYQKGSVTIYYPLTHKAARVIASNMVEPKLWCKSTRMKWSPKEVLPKGEPSKNRYYPGAKWCIAMETDMHWELYISEQRKFFIVCNPDASVEKEKKICYTYDKGNKFEYLTYADDSDSPQFKVFPELKEIMDKYCKEQALRDKEKKWELLPNYFNKGTGRYDYLNKEFTPDDLVKNGKFVVPIGIWEGDFNCDHNHLISLEGAPKEVKENFYCSDNDLTSLEGAPEYVGGNFYCSYNKFTTLEGAPKYIGRDFDCHFTPLTSLKGAPREVGGDFDCSSNHLTSLEGAPEYVGGDFDCSSNHLTSLEGAPEYVGGDFNCSGNKLTSLKGCPEKIGEDLMCSYSQLTSLEGCPERIEGRLMCYQNENLTSLKGAPKYVGKNFNCSECSLTSLEGAPEYVGGDFICGFNPLTSLEGKPKHIGGKFKEHSSF